MARLKIGFFGDGPWAHRSLEKLVADPSLEVMFVAFRAASPDLALAKLADQAKIPVRSWPDVNDAPAIRQIAEFDSDLLVSMSFDQIIKKALIELPRLGFINCHAGRLPFYRGRNVLNWALINGESEFAVTVHYIDASIDTGDIIRQDVVPILSGDDYGAVLEKAYLQCAETLYAAVQSIRAGLVHAVPQRSIHPIGFYCVQRHEGDEWVDWSWSSARIVHFVRALASPGPGARTERAGDTYCVWSATLVSDAPAYIGIPGTVVGRDEKGVYVKTGDTFILISSMAKLGETPQAPTLRLGTRLGGDLRAEATRLKARVEALERELARMNESSRKF